MYEIDDPFLINALSGSRRSLLLYGIAFPKTFAEDLFL